MNYLSLNTHLKERFGRKIYKLALSGGMTCPNRDGTLDTRGCIFCSGSGSGDFCEKFDPDIAAQIERAKSRVANKAGENAGYIAYFQNFSNTYAHISHLTDIFYKAIEHPDIVGLSIATRPDCLGDDVIKLIGELTKIKPVWVELGLQTVHPDTVNYIRRCYDNGVYETAVKSLHAAGAEVVTHVILGLPHETREMMFQTVEFVAKYTDGIKLQLLHVLENTDLAADYRAGKFETLDMDEYIEILAECVMRLPPHIVIHRLTGDGAKRDLVAPLWSADKKRVLNAINKYFAFNNIVQGGKRKKLRLEGYDYSKEGAYFITVCTKDRKQLFWQSDIKDQKRYDQWSYPTQETPSEEKGVGAVIGRPEYTLSEIGEIVKQAILNIPKYYPVTVDNYVIMADHIHLLISVNKRQDVSLVINQMKGFVSKKAGFSLWQRSYYDHIIRDEQDYLEKWQYIENNTLKKGTT